LKIWQGAGAQRLINQLKPLCSRRAVTGGSGGYLKGQFVSGIDIGYKQGVYNNMDTHDDYQRVLRLICDNDYTITLQGKRVTINETGQVFQCSSKAKAEWYLLHENIMPYGYRETNTPGIGSIDLRTKRF